MFCKARTPPSRPWTPHQACPQPARCLQVLVGSPPTPASSRMPGPLSAHRRCRPTEPYPQHRHETPVARREISARFPSRSGPEQAQRECGVDAAPRVRTTCKTAAGTRQTAGSMLLSDSPRLQPANLPPCHPRSSAIVAPSGIGRLAARSACSVPRATLRAVSRLQAIDGLKAEHERAEMVIVVLSRRVWLGRVPAIQEQHVRSRLSLRPARVPRVQRRLGE